MSIAGRLNEPALVYYAITDNKTGTQTSDVASLTAGQMAFDIPYEIGGDELETGVSSLSVQIASTKGAVVGAASTSVTVNDDELTPDVKVEPVVASTSEGSALRWTFSVPRASARPIAINVLAVAPEAGTNELSLDDIDEQNQSPRVLSDARLALGVTLEPGQLSTTLEIPTLRDAQVEGQESIALEITSRAVGMPFPARHDVCADPGPARRHAARGNGRRRALSAACCALSAADDAPATALRALLVGLLTSRTGLSILARLGLVPALACRSVGAR